VVRTAARTRERRASFIGLSGCIVRQYRLDGFHRAARRRNRTMSEALDYLLKVRPEAMGHYFRFLKEAGRHLDPKTRSLISVITKVHAQTEAGFRQYLKRALKDGATPMEILDALLMAFPALGLTRIVWAVDLLLAMDLPEFRPEALAGEPGWHPVCALDDVADGTTARIDAAGKALLVHRNAQAVRVYDAHCPHQDTLLTEDALEGNRLVCSRHGWEFDTRDGRAVKGFTPLREYPSRLEERTVLARW
jgi:nitrite reductase/ring-hydroxylating ferredoxin subunit/alkylhydroperoxidase/carboxymuconolactone decarboxylase family protein YurZ